MIDIYSQAETLLDLEPDPGYNILLSIQLKYMFYELKYFKILLNPTLIYYFNYITIAWSLDIIGLGVNAGSVRP